MATPLRNVYKTVLLKDTYDVSGRIPSRHDRVINERAWANRLDVIQILSYLRDRVPELRSDWLEPRVGFCQNLTRQYPSTERQSTSPRGIQLIGMMFSSYLNYIMDLDRAVFKAGQDTAVEARGVLFFILHQSVR